MRISPKQQIQSGSWILWLVIFQKGLVAADSSDTKDFIAQSLGHLAACLAPGPSPGLPE